MVLLLCAGFDDSPPLASDRTVLQRVLRWAGEQPPGALALSDAPLPPDLCAALQARDDRLDRMLDAALRDGGWIVGAEDGAYPKRLRRRLGRHAPPVLFGRGEFGLIGRGGAALVTGSAGSDRLADFAARLRQERTTVIRHDADRSTILFDGAETSARLHAVPPGIIWPALAEAMPAAQFALADAVLVGGLRRTDDAWRAIAALIEADRQPVWIDGTGEDATALIRAGGRPLALDGPAEGLKNLIEPPPIRTSRLAQDPAPQRRALYPVPAAGFAEAQAAFGVPRQDGIAPNTRAPTHLRVLEGAARPPAEVARAMPTLFELFVDRLTVLLTQGPLGAVRIAEAMDLTRPQVDAWLLRAETAKAVRFDPETRLFGRPGYD